MEGEIERKGDRQARRQLGREAGREGGREKIGDDGRNGDREESERVGERL